MFHWAGTRCAASIFLCSVVSQGTDFAAPTSFANLKASNTS